MNFDHKKSTVLLTLVGSRGYGLRTESSDFDWKGVCIEPFEAVAGFTGFEQYEEKPSPNEEVTVYGLRKFLKLALKGNPTIIEMLFAHPITRTPTGKALQDLAPMLVSKQAGKAYMGYMLAQWEKLKRGKNAEGVRADVIAQHGYDTKFAMHTLRLAMQGIELMSSGRISLPLGQADRDFLLDVRNGKFPYEDCLKRIDNLNSLLVAAYQGSPLPEHPNHKAVEEWMLGTYWAYWNGELK